MPRQTPNYAALARQHGGQLMAAPERPASIDYAALAREFDGSRASDPDDEPAEPDRPGTLSNMIGNYQRRVVDTVKGAADVAKGMVTPRTEGAMRFLPPPIATQLELAKGLYESHVGQAEKAFTAAGQGRLTEAAGHGGAAILPVLGPLAAGIGEQAGTGDVSGAAGTALADLTMMAVPKVVSAGRTAAAAKLTKVSEQAVTAAVKPTVSALRKITGAAGEGLDAKARTLVRFIIDNRLTTPHKAQALIVQAEHELQTALKAANAPTDAATRAGRYLDALKKSAAKQGLAGDDLAQLEAASAELVNGVMGKDAFRLVKNPETGEWAAEQVGRKLRESVPATEALESARASSRWSTNKQWGEQKGTATEARKAVERAQRDAVKDAVPGAREALSTQGKAIQAKDVLDRMAQRTANRDVVSLPAHVMAGAGMAAGAPANAALMGLAANWLRNNQMKVGIWGDRLAKAIERNDVGRVRSIMHNLGASTVIAEGAANARATSPSGSRTRTPAGATR